MIAADSSQDFESPTAANLAVRSISWEQVIREMVEAIVVAVILAFLFRGFVAEAFVIPTGSMAPTLQGRHMDVVCAECGYQYRTGASVENDDFGPARGEVTHTRCPICRFTMELDKQADLNQRSFNGDRILVSKFAYAFREPQRWDVIVFKYPGNAKINYIKRLVGLPGETLQIRHGDIYIQRSAAGGDANDRPEFQIERKPPETVLAMLQLVNDSRYVSKNLAASDWPAHWKSDSTDTWRPVPAGGFYQDRRSQLAWLRYRHIVPSRRDWQSVRRGQQARGAPDFQGRLITDYYAYNDSLHQSDNDGDCWVGDLAVECDLHVVDGHGDLVLDLVEGGVHFRCSIAVATGQATLAITDEQVSFVDADGRVSRNPESETVIRGPGDFRVRFANVDDQLHLWINDQLVQFQTPTTFAPRDEVAPRWSPTDPGDLEPVGIGARDLEMQVRHLRVLRDVYYRAVAADTEQNSEYRLRHYRSAADIDAILSQPDTWQSTDLFASRRSVTFRLAADQFFPLGDNSPQSKDARLWSSRSYAGADPEPPPYVDRHLLIGRALAIYWPHGWRVHREGLGIIPNFQRISLIR